MKFILAVSSAQHAAKLVRDVPSSRPDVVEHGGVLIEARDGLVYFTTFNPNIVARVAVAADGVEKGSALVSASDFSNAILRFMAEKPDGSGSAPLKFSLSGKTGKLTITTKTKYLNGAEIPQKRVFASMSHEVFPKLGGLSSDDWGHSLVKVEPEVLTSAVSSVAYALSSDQTHGLFTGVLIETIPDYGILFTASNGLCLAEYKVPVPRVEERMRCIVPGKLMAKAARAFGEGELVDIRVDSGKILFRNTGIAIGGPLIQDEYPDYNAMLPKYTNKLSVDREVFQDNIDNLIQLSAKDEENRIKIAIEGDSMAFSAGQSYNTGIPCVGYNESLSFEAKARQVAISTRYLAGSEIDISIVDDDKPVLFSSEESFANGGTLKCILVPLSPEG